MFRQAQTALMEKRSTVNDGMHENVLTQRKTLYIIPGKNLFNRDRMAVMNHGFSLHTLFLIDIV